MKILITGANGLLGQHLVKVLLQEGHEVIGIGKGPSRLPTFDSAPQFNYISVDITDDAALKELFSFARPLDTVIHAAAMTQVDICEQNRQECESCNVNATQQLVEYSNRFCKHLVYISTDFVFNGKKGLYDETDQLDPVNWYGQTKSSAESIVRLSSIPWSIVRTCLVYGNTLAGTRSNFITWVKENLEQGHEIKVVSDQVRTPTYVEDLAAGISLVVSLQAAGIFHISGKNMLTPYDMALVTAGYFNLKKSLIKKVDARTFSQPAVRPLKTGFNISKARKELGYEPHTFKEALKIMYGQK